MQSPSLPQGSNGHAKFPHGADATFDLGLFEDPSISDSAANNDNYGFQLYGVYVPPSSGFHRFYISSDDGGACYLSSDEQPAN